jgi:hydroxyacylglutathione hydrolase
MKVECFTFNPFQENTYVVFDDTKECIIIDCGCSDTNEEARLKTFIESRGLKPVRYIQTHCHIDHVMGNHFINQEYNLEPEYHLLEKPVLDAAESVAQQYMLPFQKGPDGTASLLEGEELTFGHSSLKILFTPGHSPGSVCFYSQNNEFVIVGDALFQMSIGRTDLPGGNHADLIASIKSELFTLPAETVVYSGHGPQTQIGFELEHNPFF